VALRTKTIEYAFQSRNGAALAAATRYDFGAITLYIPETTSRTFRSVIVKVFCRDAVTMERKCMARRQVLSATPHHSWPRKLELSQD